MIDIHIHLSPYAVSESLLDKFFLESFLSGKNVFMEDCKFYASEKLLVDFIKEKFSNVLISQNYKSLIYERTLGVFISLPDKPNEDHIYAKIYGEQEGVNIVKNLLLEKFTEIKTTIEWVYNQRGNTLSIPVLSGNYPSKEFYPFINTNTLEEYYDEYVKSSSSILILIGPPGTGKTSFVRGFLQHSTMSATLSYDPKVLGDDDFFADFIRDNDRKVLILEDADSLLAPRKDGNNLMMKFLNIGEGLVSSQGKKIIFTTNLPNIKHIDSALTRPGRCFDILHFDKLSPEQAKDVAIKMNLGNSEFPESLTLAEVFNSKGFSSTLKSKAIGFHSN